MRTAGGSTPRGAGKGRGAAMIEFAIALPFLILLVTTFYDLGAVLNLYLKLYEAVHQGVRAAVTTDGLTVGQFSGLASPQFCSSVGSDSEHEELQERVIDLLVLENPGLVRTQVCVESGRTPNVVGSTNPLNNTVYVKMVYSFDGFSPFFHGFPVTVEARSAFLF